MRKIYKIAIVLLSVFTLFSCSSSNKVILKVEEHKHFYQNLTVPVSYERVYDVGDVGYKATLVAYDGYLYIGNLDGEVYAVNPKNEESRLIVEFENQPIEASVAVDRNFLFVGTDRGFLYKVNLVTGKILKKRRFDFPIVGRIYVRNGKVYFTEEDDKVYCLDENNLNTIWVYTHGPYNTLDIRGFSGITFGKDGMYVGFDDGSVDKISYQGEQIWESSVGEGNMFIDADTTPVINGNLVYVSSTRGFTEALNAKDGSLVWKRKISSYSNIQTNIFGVFIADEDGNVYCLDSSGGETIWKRKLTNSDIYSLKLVGSILFVITQNGRLVALDTLTGKVLDVKELRGDFSSYITSCCNRLFVVSRDGEIYSIFSER